MNERRRKVLLELEQEMLKFYREKCLTHLKSCPKNPQLTQPPERTHE
ncbi:hypothetical protein NIES4101_83440 [Calothrix sp. NIES-4101]|nr:hypothetical protein NIES4101_83440 [Calothrix sp. NIES-4101]